MNRLASLSERVRRSVSDLPALIAARWKSNFYVYLAIGFSFFIGVDALFLHVTANMRQAAFDTIVRYRLIVPKPDKDIVIVDINEASLAAMAKDYGRWPWPRQVLGEFLEHLERQRPKAVVFDILFSDPDIYNPDSDSYFNAAVSATTNTFFPMLRLDEASDPLSQISPAMIPGAAPIPGEAEENAHLEADRVAVVLAARAGYDPFGLPTVLQDLGRVTKDDSRISLLFKTHPHPDDRLTELGEAVGGRLDGIKGQTLQQRLYRIKF